MNHKVGVFILDGMKFDLVLTPGSNCSFTWPTSPDSKLIVPLCEIGYNQPWHEVVKGLIHELFEAACMEHNVLFERTTWLTDRSCGRHIIHMDHAVFTEICNAVGDVLTYALPAVLKAYKEKA